MLDDRDPAAAVTLQHPERLTYVQHARWWLLPHKPMVLPGSAPIPGWRFLRATSNRRQGERLARLAALVGDRAGRSIRILELGTSMGISGMYLLCGMAQAEGGHLATFEGRPDVAASARQRMQGFIDHFGLGSKVSFEVTVGNFEQTFEPYLRAHVEPLDLVFIDGHHQHEPTLRYHALAREVLSPGGVIAHDDIAWTPGMERAWAEICEQEKAHRIVEHWQGGRPSRGIIYYGQPPLPTRPRIDLDRMPERLARHVLRVATGARG